MKTGNVRLFHEDSTPLRYGPTVIGTTILGAYLGSYAGDLAQSTPGLYSFEGLAIGGLSGLLAGIFGSSHMIRKLQERRDSLDEEALASGAPFARFHYRSKNIDCVLRPSYQKKGKKFTMQFGSSIFDSIIFSWNPEDLLSMQSDIIIRRSWCSLLGKENTGDNSLEEYIDLVDRSNKVSPRNIHVGCTIDSSLITSVKYIGREPVKNLTKFCDVTSDLWNQIDHMFPKRYEELVLTSNPKTDQ